MQLNDREMEACNKIAQAGRKERDLKGTERFWGHSDGRKEGKGSSNVGALSRAIKTQNTIYLHSGHSNTTRTIR